MLALLEGKNEDEVFGDDDSGKPELPAPPLPAERPERRGSADEPRPGSPAAPPRYGPATQSVLSPPRAKS